LFWRKLNFEPQKAKQFIATIILKHIPNKNCIARKITMYNWIVGPILITVNTSNELAYYADSTHIPFIRLNVSHQNLESLRNLPDYRKRVNIPVKPRNHIENCTKWAVKLYCPIENEGSQLSPLYVIVFSLLGFSYLCSHNQTDHGK